MAIKMSSLDFDYWKEYSILLSLVSWRPEQIQKMCVILQGHNELLDSQSSANLAGNPIPAWNGL